MSLLLWVPLINDNLNNQGLKAVNITNNSATYSSSGGKIGSGCWSFSDGSKNGHGINIDLNFTDIGSNRSICAWVYPRGNHADYAGAIVSSGDWNSSRWSFGVERANGGFTGFDDGYASYYSTSIPTNTWTHLCVTVANGVTKFYKNGEYLGEQSRGSGTLSSNASNTMIGRETYAGGYFGFNGSIQDVRIYNHCLTPQEVKEISKGLVAHYTLESASVYEATTNVGSNDWYTYTPYWNGLSGSYGNYLLTQNNGLTLAFSNSTIANTMAAGQTWTLSGFLYKNGVPYKTSISNPSTYSGYSILSWESRNDGYFRYTMYINSVPGWLIYSEMFGSDNAQGSVVLIKLLQFELKNHATHFTATSRNTGVVYDSSGYCNNGTIINSVSLSTDSPRYKNSIDFGSDTSSYYKNCGAISCPIMLNSCNACTISFWANPIGYHSMFCLSNTSDGGGYTNVLLLHFDSNVFLGYNSGRSVTLQPTLNSWHHYVITYNATGLYLYIDGVLSASKTFSSVTMDNITYLFINYCYAGGVDRKSATKMSDFRLYATALSADDVKDLYNLGALIS